MLSRVISTTTSKLFVSPNVRAATLRGTLCMRYRGTPYIMSRSYVTIGDDDDEEVSVKPLEAIHFGDADLPKAHLIKGRYVSPWKNKKKFSHVAYLMLSSTLHNIRNMFHQEKPLPCVPVSLQKIRDTSAEHVTWLGHATCHVQIGGLFFLTDPVFSERASPLQFMGPKRQMPPPISVEALPIDYVLLSHTHYDHFDIESAKRIGNRAKWVVPAGVKSQLASIGITNVTELEWWEKITVNDNVEIVFTPAMHWTGRTLMDRNTALWGSFIVRNPTFSFFFAGDTAYCDVFQLIGKYYGPFDLSLIPIGAYEPRWFMKDVHVNPEEAVKIHKDLRSKQSLAIHWATFKLTTEPLMAPAYDLHTARVEGGVTKDEFFTVTPGATHIVGKDAESDFATENS